jgi:hypothetical protein
MMDPHQFKTRCSICGGTGVATGNTIAGEWTGAKIVHSNPETCRRILERRAKELEEREKRTQ